jgi:hypothetical protein
MNKKCWVRRTFNGDFLHLFIFLQKTLNANPFKDLIHESSNMEAESDSKEYVLPPEAARKLFPAIPYAVNIPCEFTGGDATS